jgi:hypothetical protein
MPDTPPPSTGRRAGRISAEGASWSPVRTPGNCLLALRNLSRTLLDVVSLN